MTVSDNNCEKEMTPEVSACLTPGAVLAARRCELGCSIREVAITLKLSPRQVEALEADRYGDLPGNTFVRGFIRNYARFLGCDVQPLMVYLDQHLPLESPQAALPKLSEQAVPIVNTNKRHYWQRLVLLLSLLVTVTIGALWIMQSPWWKAGSEGGGAGLTSVEVLPPALPTASLASHSVGVDVGDSAAPLSLVPQVEKPGTDAARQMVAQELVSPAVVAPVLSGEVGSDNDVLQVSVSEDSWLLIMDAQAKHLFSGIVTPAKGVTVRGTPPYRLRVGNAPQTKVVYQGKVIDLKAYTNKSKVADVELK